MSVIAMTREMGSLGKDVAAGLAEQLALRLFTTSLSSTTSPSVWD
jgi:hypothetical protein